MPTSIAWPRVGFMKEYWIRVVTRNIQHQLELIDWINLLRSDVLMQLASLIFPHFYIFGWGFPEYLTFNLENFIGICNTTLIGIWYKSIYVLWLFIFFHVPPRKHNDLRIYMSEYKFLGFLHENYSSIACYGLPVEPWFLQRLFFHCCYKVHRSTSVRERTFYCLLKGTLKKILARQNITTFITDAC